MNANLALLKIPSLLGLLGLPSGATVLFNRPSKGLMPRLNRTSINGNEDHYNTLRMCQYKYIRNNDTLKEPFLIPTGSTAAVHCKYYAPWIPGMVLENAEPNHNPCSYRVRVIKTGHIFTSNLKHVRKTCIMVEQYLQNQLMKSSNNAGTKITFLITAYRAEWGTIQPIHHRWTTNGNAYAEH